MKKVLFYLLAVMVLFTVACGSESTTADTAATDSAETESTEAVANFWEADVAKAVYAEAGTPATAEGATAEGATVYVIDAASSSMAWYGEKAAYGHNGTIDVQEGSFEVVDGNVVGGSFVVDMTSIKDLDIDDAEKNGKLVGHLASDDFFNVESFPTANLVITDVVNAEGNTFDVSANLTIRDKTHQVTFPATIEVSDSGVMAEATFSIDRSKFDVKYNSGVFFVDMAADKIISDEIAFNIKLSAAPAEAASAE
jgi:polyisoprenoid-binding protein YceI